MNRRSLLKTFGMLLAGFVLSPIRAVRAALPRKLHLRDARWKHHLSPAWLEAYGGHHVATATRPARAARVNLTDEQALADAMADVAIPPDNLYWVDRARHLRSGEPVN